MSFTSDKRKFKLLATSACDKPNVIRPSAKIWPGPTISISSLSSCGANSLSIALLIEQLP